MAYHSLPLTDQLQLYLIRDESLLYSARSQRLFGLDRATTVTLLMLADGELPHDPAAPAVAELVALLAGEEPPAEEYRSQLFCPDAPPSEPLSSCYRLLTTTFALVCDNPALVVDLHRLCSHLAVPGTAVPDLLFGVWQESELVRLTMNGVPQGEAGAEHMLLPLLLGRLRMYAYQRMPYLLALHAAVVSWRDKTIILPGESGAGKSTLATALLARGGRLYSDEVALVLGDGSVAPIPLPPGLKSGSWPVLNGDFPCLSAVDEHLRWDGLRIRYLPAETIGFAAQAGRASHLIFPRFSPGSSGNLEHLSPVQAMRRLTDGCFQVRNLEEEEAEAIVVWLTGLSCAAMTYASTAEALQLLAGELGSWESTHGA